jgi:hypothetical protein
MFRALHATRIYLLALPLCMSIVASVMAGIIGGAGRIVAAAAALLLSLGVVRTVARRGIEPRRAVTTMWRSSLLIVSGVFFSFQNDALKYLAASVLLTALSSPYIPRPRVLTKEPVRP